MYTANSNGRTMRSTLFRSLRASAGSRGSSSWPATRSTASSTPLLLLASRGNSGHVTIEETTHILILLHHWHVNGLVDRWGLVRHVAEWCLGLVSFLNTGREGLNNNKKISKVALGIFELFWYSCSCSTDVLPDTRPAPATDAALEIKPSD